MKPGIYLMSKEAFFRVCRATNFRVCRATKGQELVLCYTVLHDTSIHILLQKISVWVCFKFYRVIYHCHIHNIITVICDGRALLH